VYDALVSRRAYRPAWSREEALALLHEESYIAFDPRCVAALERIVSPRTAAAAEVVLTSASPAPSAP
jgi:HD-GYP domain-containing protein (c-di-GMP phosphodiesterase class II)